VNVQNPDLLSGLSQSLLKLRALVLWEGSDKYKMIMLGLFRVAPEFNAMCARGNITVEGLGVRPVRPLSCGDLQWHKAESGQNMGRHSVFCKCGETHRLLFPPLSEEPAADAFPTWEAAEQWLGSHCSLKTLRELVELNHCSWEVFCGRPFQPFGCSQEGCEGLWYATEEAWRAAMATAEKLEAPIPPL